jgi:predicted esterase
MNSNEPFSFGPTHVVPPTTAHTHTAVILHGRGDTGSDFADEFLSSTLSNGKTLQALLPSWRWVFPSAPELWSTAFQEDMPAWFEAHSLTDPSARQDLQTPGLLASIDHASHVMREEVERLGGDEGKVVLGGISQGGAVAMLTLLSGRGTGIGGFFAASTWLPFAADVEGALLRGKVPGETDETPRDVILRLLYGGLRDNSGRRAPVLLCHGTDDAYVDVDLGREAARILRQAGHNVTWREYTGAEQEGHWFKVPEGIDDVLLLLKQAAQE